MYYILVDKNPVEAPDVLTWGKWFENTDRHVAQDHPVPGVHVSTVFVGIDMGFGAGAPILFETMVFGGPMDGEMDRYSTWEEAEVGHKKMVKRAEQNDLL